jgi:RNA polymerase sigma-70 factor (ECF subfamily)
MTEPPATRPSLLVRLRDPQDERAWGEFVEIYGPLVRRLARRRGLQDADAADLAQEVFRAVASAIERYDPDPSAGSFRGWLFTIARNLLVNLLASQRRHPRGTGDTDMREFLESRPAPDAEDAALFEAEYRRGLLEWAAGRVRGESSEAVWQAFWRSAVEGRSAVEVARALGLTVGTVYQYKSRVVAGLRREIERVEGGDGRQSTGGATRR